MQSIQPIVWLQSDPEASNCFFCESVSDACRINPEMWSALAALASFSHFTQIMLFLEKI